MSEIVCGCLHVPPVQLNKILVVKAHVCPILLNLISH